MAVGFVDVLFISWPSLSFIDTGFLGTDQALGVIATLASALLAAFASILVRRLVDTEKTSTIVLYFSLTASVLSLATLPFGWVALGVLPLTLLVLSGVLGGMGQILLTESYRHAPVSTVAPFEYTSIVLGIAVGYFYFGELPQSSMLFGTSIVIGAGLFIILRERRLGIARKGARRFTTPAGVTVVRSPGRRAGRARKSAVSVRGSAEWPGSRCGPFPKPVRGGRFGSRRKDRRQRRPYR